MSFIFPVGKRRATFITKTSSVSFVPRFKFFPTNTTNSSHYFISTLYLIIGAPRQARTAALLIKGQLLYQLSYGRIFGSFCFRKVFQPKLIANLNCVHQFSSDLLLVLGAADETRTRKHPTWRDGALPIELLPHI